MGERERRKVCHRQLEIEPFSLQGDGISLLGRSSSRVGARRFMANWANEPFGDQWPLTLLLLLFARRKVLIHARHDCSCFENSFIHKPAQANERPD